MKQKITHRGKNTNTENNKHLVIHTRNSPNIYPHTRTPLRTPKQPPPLSEPFSCPRHIPFSMLSFTNPRGIRKKKFPTHVHILTSSAFCSSAIRLRASLLVLRLRSRAMISWRSLITSSAAFSTSSRYSCTISGLLAIVVVSGSDVVVMLKWCHFFFYSNHHYHYHY